MKILVTGGAGFIGSHVVDALIEAGHDVVIVDSLITGHRTNLNPRARFYEVDVRSPELAQVFEAERPEIVNHHAAQMDVRRSVDDPLYDADVNILGSVNLLELARRSGVRKVVYISSGGAVYGEPRYLPCDENHPIDPLCPYGASKHIVEHYLYMYRENYDLDYTVLRYGNVYGPRQDPHGEAGVVAIFTGLLLASRQPTINGTGEQERDYVYVGDCVRANLIAMERGSGGVYNIGCGVGTSVIQIFNTLNEITGFGDEPRHGPPKLGETFRIFLDVSEARSELKWEPQVSLQQGLEETVMYFRADGAR